ncbi:MAG: O-antigen ligase family protein, partial [Candidatus Paceibacterota bacterium]
FMSALFYLMSLIVILQVFMINKGVLNRSAGEIKIMYLGWGTKNVVSIALEITLPFICYILGKYRFRLDCYLLLFIDYVLIFISDSRGGIVTSILMLPLLSFIVVSRASRNKIHDFILFLCFFTFILISAIYFIPSVKESFIRLLNMRDDISGRGEIWQRCINYFKASPIFGGSMSCLFDMFQVYMHGENIGIWLCHNTFFTFLASLGAAGVLAYAFNLFESFFNLIRSKTGLMLPISGFLLIGLIHGMIDNTFFSIVYMLPFIILMSGERKKYSFKRDKKPSLTY